MTRVTAALRRPSMKASTDAAANHRFRAKDFHVKAFLLMILVWASFIAVLVGKPIAHTAYTHHCCLNVLLDIAVVSVHV